jgi:hypothetical protein
MAHEVYLNVELKDVEIKARDTIFVIKQDGEKLWIGGCIWRRGSRMAGITGQRTC